MAPSENPDVDAIVVGAGIGGIRALWELTQLGLKVRCIEAGTDVGGAWYWNKYPGARTDSEAWAYIMNFAPEVQSQWDYKERYPSQKEVQDYLKRVVGRFSVAPYLSFILTTAIKTIIICGSISSSAPEPSQATTMTRKACGSSPLPTEYP